jgi:hypothetical protein
MTFRKTTARGLGIGLVLTLLSGACAEARPVGDPGAAGPLASRAGGYELQVLVDGVPAPTFFQGAETYVMGEMGARYTLRIVNHTGRRIEAVASVDGRDVVDGRAADVRTKRGYLVPAWGQVDIDGWRLSRAQVAAFRFSTVSGSYAARTGSAREVGVIGAAIFPERYVPRPRPRPLELPYTDPRASAPETERYHGHGLSEDRLESDGASPADKKSEAWNEPAAAPAAPWGAGAPAARSSAEASRRPGLGTEFGEAVGSSVREVAFVRESAGTPAVILGARYNDREGLVALGIEVDPAPCEAWACDRDRDLRQTANPFPGVERHYTAPPPCWNGRDCR